MDCRLTFSEASAAVISKAMALPRCICELSAIVKKINNNLF